MKKTDFEKTLNTNFKNLNYDISYTEYIMSSKSILYLLDKAIQSMYKTEYYLNFGIYKGGSLIVPMRNNKDKKAIGVDNWCKFDDGGKNKSTVEKYIKNYELDINIYSMGEIEYLKQTKIKKFGVVFLDGGHDFNTLIKDMELLQDKMVKNGLLFVDDTNRKEIQNAIKFALKNYNYEKIFEKKEPKKNPNGFWEGLVILRKK
jgi:hypothetical protein